MTKKETKRGQPHHTSTPSSLAFFIWFHYAPSSFTFFFVLSFFLLFSLSLSKPFRFSASLGCYLKSHNLTVKKPLSLSVTKQTYLTRVGHPSNLVISVTATIRAVGFSHLSEMDKSMSMTVSDGYLNGHHQNSFSSRSSSRRDQDVAYR